MEEQDPQQQYLHLVQLVWALHRLGVAARVVFPLGDVPCVEIPTASERVKILAVRRGRGWLFTWGRGPERSVRAGTPGAAERIAEAAAGRA
jgi:hypothetical protein